MTEAAGAEAGRGARRVLVLATANPGKAAELHRLLAPLGAELRDLRQWPRLRPVAEEHGTYAENALAKALAAARATGLPALADDSGLEVDALGGAPGVHSARFAGPRATDRENVALLLERLRGLPPTRRTARFRCVLALVLPGGRTALAEGTCEGWIAITPRGTGGFGYDPVFVDAASGRTFAELPAAEKERRSHRAAAVRRFLPTLRDVLGAAGGRDGW